MFVTDTALIWLINQLENIVQTNIKNCTAFNSSKEEAKFIAFRYAPDFTSSLQNIFRNMGMTIVYLSSNKLQNVLGNPKNKKKTDYEKPRIYEVPKL